MEKTGGLTNQDEGGILHNDFVSDVEVGIQPSAL